MQSLKTNLTVDLVLVIPVYNFETGIGQTLEKIKTWVIEIKDQKVQVIFSDDGSTDQTLKQLKEFQVSNSTWCELVENSTNSGKGMAVRLGFKRAKAFHPKYIFYTDCDLHYGLRIILERLLPELTHSDVVMVDRSWVMSTRKKPAFVRKLASGVFKRMASVLSGVSYLDTQAGLKGFSAKVSNPIFDLLTLSGFTFDVEILSIATYYRLRIKVVSIEFESVCKFPLHSSVMLLQNSLSMTADLCRINWNWKAGRYFSRELQNRIDQEVYCIKKEESKF